MTTTAILRDRIATYGLKHVRNCLRDAMRQEADVLEYRKAADAITLASIRGADLRLVNRDPSGFAPR